MPGLTIQDLLRAATVRIDINATPSGTGFFVAPGTIVTCFHVVASALLATGDGAPTIRVVDASDGEHEVDVAGQWPEERIDLALLELRDTAEHRCVLLDAHFRARDQIDSFGFTQKYPGGGPTTLEIEGQMGGPGWLKLKGGQVQPGMSGGAAVNTRTGGVCGVLKRTRDPTTDLGGYAIPLSTLFAVAPRVETQNSDLHASDSTWLDLVPKDKLVHAAGEAPEGDADRRVVGIRPVGSLELWQDREALRHDLKALLMKGQRIISVVGRRGVGKSGVVTKVLADFEEPEAGDTAGMDGIVYMSTRTGSGEMTLAYIFHQIVELLPASEQIRLSNRWASAGEATLDDLFDSLRARRVVVVLDNLDDLQEPETGKFRTSDVPTFLTAIAKAPRAPQVVTTSQQRPLFPLEVLPYVTERELQDGLESNYGAALLRELDTNGQLKELADPSLRALSDRVGGVPRGLQLLVAYVRDHRVSGVRRLLDSTSAPEVVLEELVSTTYEGLVGAARDVMDVIAVAAVPLSPDAFIVLCEDQSPDDVENVLDDLVKRCSLVLGDDGLVRLHPLDTDYVQSKLEHDRFVAFDLRLAEWYARESTDRDAWRRLIDADPVKQEYRHRWRAGQRPEALDVLAGAARFLARHGDSRVLKAAVAAADQAGLDASPSRHVCLGAAEFYSGSLETAAECFRTASRLAGGAPEWDMWTGIALRQTGHGREAAKVLSPVASGDRNPRKLRIGATFELVLAWCYAGQLDDAAGTISKLEALIGADDSALNRAYVANVSALLHLMAGRLLESVSAAEEGIAAYADSPNSPTAAYVRNTRGVAYLLMGRAADAAADFSAVTTAGAAVGQDRLEGIGLANSAWASVHLGAWEDAAAVAQQALERLTSSSGDTATPQALIELLTAKEEADIEQLLRRLAENTDVNPDFYRPPPHSIKELGSALASR